jgi:hypothetical protein
LAETTILKALEKEINEPRHDSPEHYRQYFADPKKLEVMLLGSKNSALFAYTWVFEGKEAWGRVRLELKRYDCPGSSCPPGKPSIVFAGRTSGIDRYYKDTLRHRAEIFSTG